MCKIDFITFCYEKDVHELHENLDDIVSSHKFAFDNVIVVHQNCKQIQDFKRGTERVVYTEDFPNILPVFGIPNHDPLAEEITHGPSCAHYWKKYTINHLVGLMVSNADYIVFSDSDCEMVRQPETPWVIAAIQILKIDKKTLVVSPSDGNPGPTQIMSQQLFCCEARRFRMIDFCCWDGKFIDGGPMQEYYAMLEGRVGMYMLKHGLHRHILSNEWRYWHDRKHHPLPEEFK